MLSQLRCAFHNATIQQFFNDRNNSTNADNFNTVQTRTDRRAKIIELHAIGKNYPETSRETGYSNSGVRGVLRKRKEEETLESQPRSGRPHILPPNSTVFKAAGLHIEAHPEDSSEVIHDVLWDITASASNQLNIQQDNPARFSTRTLVNAVQCVDKATIVL